MTPLAPELMKAKVVEVPEARGRPGGSSVNVLCKGGMGFRLLILQIHEGSGLGSVREEVGWYG